MERLSGNIIETLMYRWQTATMTEYASVVLAIVLIGWFVSHYTSK